MGQLTEEPGKRRNGAAAAILADCPTRIDANVKKNGGLSAAVLPLPIPRTSLFARHSRGFTTQNSLLHSAGDQKHRRMARM
jgi:hypothetical protein